MEDLIIASIPLLIAVLTGFIFYKQIKPGWFRLLPFFLLLVFVIQLSGYLYSAHYKKSNHFIFNCYIFIASVFYFFIFYKAVADPRLKKIILSIFFLYISMYAYQIFLLKHFWVYSSLMANAGDFFVLCCSLFYLAELLLVDDWVNYFSIPMFWITIAVIISAVGNFLYLGFLNYIIQHNLDPDGTVYGVISTVISVIEYGLFTLAFLCKRLWIKTNY